jgi:hypothetical protein
MYVAFNNKIFYDSLTDITLPSKINQEEGYGVKPY